MTDKKVPQQNHEKPPTTEYARRSKEPVGSQKR